jgi:hypothetical protein
MGIRWTKAIRNGIGRDAAIAITVGVLAGCAAPAMADQAAQAGTGQAHAGQTAGTVAKKTALPTLGRVWGPGGQEGYGKVRPSTVYNGGDETGLVKHIKWSSWGGKTATGTGESVYVAPGQFTYQGTLQGVTIVAFDLGTCGGHPAYRAVEWYFPQHGMKFMPHNYINDCTGQYVGD